MKDIDLKENGHAVSTLGSSLSLGLVGINGVPDLIKVILEKQAWRKRFVAATRQVVEFDSFMAFLDAYQPEGLHAKYEDLKRLCHERVDVQDLLEQAVKGDVGNPTFGSKPIVSNIHNSDRPAGTTRAAGLRKLRKYADERPEVAEVYAKVLSVENRRLTNFNSICDISLKSCFGRTR